MKRIKLTWDAIASHVEIERDKEGYAAWMPEYPGCMTQADTIEELRAAMVEAAELYFETLRKRGRPLPPWLEAQD